MRYNLYIKQLSNYFLPKLSSKSRKTFYYATIDTCAIDIQNFSKTNLLSINILQLY